MKTPFDSTTNPMASRRALFIGFAAVSLLMGLMEFLQPTLVRPVGRWSVVFGYLWDEFGSMGICIYWVLQSCVLGGFAMIKGRK